MLWLYRHDVVARA